MAVVPLTMSAILGMGLTPITLKPSLAERFASAAANLADSYDPADSAALLAAIGSARDGGLLQTPQTTPTIYTFPLSTGPFPGAIGIWGGQAPVNETLLYLRPPMFTISPERLSVGALLDLAV